MHLAKSRADYFRRSGRQHVSLQASLFDLPRLHAMMPLRLEKQFHHIEELIEEAGMRLGNGSYVYLPSRDLGVAKCKCKGQWSYEKRAKIRNSPDMCSNDECPEALLF